MMRIALNRGWEFTECFSEEFLTGKEGPNLQVDLPHSCCETPYHYFDESCYQMVCGYRRRISVPEEWAGKRVFLWIGAAGHTAEVYLNGKLVGSHEGGYTAFRTELTEELRCGDEMLLAIRVDSRETQNIPPFGYVIDYMTYGGLYREVYLEVKEDTFIEDIFVKPSVAEDQGILTGKETAREIADVSVDGILISELSYEGDQADRIRQSLFLFGREEEPPLEVQELPLAGRTEMQVRNVRLWDALSPQLYTLRTELMQGGDVKDIHDTTLGFRRAEFRKDGFYLNGRRFQIIGLDRHQSFPYVGYAMPKSQQRRDAEILRQELGVNAVRTSHYPQSQHFIDRCDELGLLVFTEIPGWQHIGDEKWKDAAVRNTEEMVRQYRNHPSIILWGVRINESADDDAFYLRTNETAHRLDDTRQTGGVRNFRKSHLLEDVYTYNDFIHSGKNRGCLPKKKVTPDPEKPYLITEYNGHMFPTKTFDCEVHRQEHALRHANVLDAVAGEKDIAGSFGWCMADYNTHRDFGSGDRICYHGVTDMFRNPKLAAGVYAAMQDEIPVLEVSSAMDIGEHAEGQRGRLFVFTNADRVLMYRGQRLIKEYTHADSPYRNLARPPIEIDDYLGDLLEKEEPFSPRQARYVKQLLNHWARFGFSHMPPSMLFKIVWLMVRYRMRTSDAYALAGKYVGNWGVEAEGFRFEAVKDGKVVKTVVREPVREIGLKADPDRYELKEEDTYEVVSVRLSAVDQNQNVLPFWNGPVHAECSGPIEILGQKEPVLRGGLGGLYLRTLGVSGEAAVILTGEGLEPVRVEFRVTAQKGEEDIG